MHHSVKLLLPDVKIDAGGTSELSTSFESHYRVVSLDQHEHFGDYRGATRTSLLQLVRVCSSIHTPVLLPAIDMTCQEYALHLLRRCYSTVPLQTVELGMLENIFSHGCPSVKLACSIVLRQSEVAELFFNPDGWQLAYKKQRTQSVVVEERGLQMAQASYESDVRRGLMPQRLLLHPREREFFAMTVSQPMQTQSLKPTIPFDNNGTCDVASVLRPCQEQWTSIVEFCLKTLEVDAVDAARREVDDFPLTDCPLDADCAALHNHFIEDLRQSWTFLSTEVTVTEGSQEKVQELARTAMKTIEDGLVTLSSTLHEFRGHYVSGKTDSWFSVFMQLRSCCFPVEHEFSLLVSDPSGYLAQHYPWIHASDATLLIALATAWLGLRVMHDTCLRLVGMPSNALTAEVLRFEATSPRDDISRRPFWLAFEVEQRAQIRLAQYDTFVQLTETRGGPIAQLNMGEGKTHMIIPMMVLHYVFSEPSSPKLCRVVELAPILSEVRAAYTRALTYSGFGIVCLDLPFERMVPLCKKLTSRMNSAFKFFGTRAMHLIAREHLGSLVQKDRELRLAADTKKEGEEWYTSLLRLSGGAAPHGVITVFDEADELLGPQFRLVYSVGQSIELPNSDVRYVMVPSLLDALASDEVLTFLYDTSVGEVVNTTLEGAMAMARRGELPPIRLRPLEEWVSLPGSPTLRSFNEAVLSALLREDCEALLFVADLEEKEVTTFRAFILDADKFPTEAETAFLTNARRTVALLLRGLFGFEIIAHCLQLRCGVQYGIPGPNHPKDLAVPYEAAGVPSARSEFSHPEVCLLLSFMAYSIGGVTRPQFEELLRSVMNNFGRSHRESVYNMWCDAISASCDQKRLLPRCVDDISLDYHKLLDNMYDVLHKNRRFVATFLITHVFPRDMRQFEDFILCSSFDLCCFGLPKGFSGTKDNHSLLPCYVEQIKVHRNHRIAATDARMLRAIGDHTTEVFRLEASGPSWRSMLLAAIVRGAVCIIDAGALLAGQDLHAVCEWLAQTSEFVELCRSKHLRGLSYYSTNDKQWMAYDVDTKLVVPANTEIQDVDAFVIFDEARCRGSDKKLRQDALALVSVGPRMSKARLMQAVGRLRLFGRDQSIAVCAETKVFECIVSHGDGSHALPIDVVKWALANTTREIARQKQAYVELACTHDKNKGVAVRTNTAKADVTSLYDHAVATSDFAHYCNAQIVAHQPSTPENGFFDKVKDRVLLRCEGLSVTISATAAFDECEREAEEEQEDEREAEVQHRPFEPRVSRTADVPCAAWAGTTYSLLEELPICFELGSNSVRLSVSANFWRTGTLASSYSEVTGYYLSVNDVLFSQSARQLIIVSPFDVEVILKHHPPQSFQLMRFTQLLASLGDANADVGLVKACAFVQFFNGVAMFPKDSERAAIFSIIQKTASTTNTLSSSELASHFLRQRGTEADRYRESDLHKISRRIDQSINKN